MSLRPVEPDKVVRNKCAGPKDCFRLRKSKKDGRYNLANRL